MVMMALTGMAVASIVAQSQGRRATPAAPARVPLQPRFTPGMAMRYRIIIESQSNSQQSGSVKNPQGPTALDITWESTIRLEISARNDRPVPVTSPGDPAGVPLHLRVTYEDSRATVHTDAADPQSAKIQEQYAHLAGRSLEFTMAPGGQVSDVHGLEDFLSDDKARLAAEQWIVQISAASSAPAGGVVPGQKWNSTQPAQLPLGGLSWRTDSTYLRNEPCALEVGEKSAAAPGTSNAAGIELCAVILSRVALVTTRALRDPTPDDYRRTGLRTSGRWTGTGQGLLYVSLDSGWVVNSTQETTQDMDVTIAEASDDPSSGMRTVGSVTTRSHVALLAGDGPATPVR
jgi:hypothetical protein